MDTPTIRTLLVVVPLVLAGCDLFSSEEETEEDTPKFSTIQTEIFSTSCALSGCHQGDQAPHGLDLSAGQAYDNLVDVPSSEIPRLMRVEPNNPDSSYLVLKLEGDPIIDGQQMPRGGEPLSSEQITLVRRWIAAGAPRNE